jgi:hypothetical protein
MRGDCKVGAVGNERVLAEVMAKVMDMMMLTGNDAVPRKQSEE